MLHIGNLVLHLVVGRLVLEAWHVEYGFSLLLVEVGDADSFDQPSIHQLLHSLLDTLHLY